MEKPFKSTLWKRIGGIFRWNRTSYLLMSGFIALILLIIYIWWPLVVEYFATYDSAIPFWKQLDWLLIGIFLFMSFLIMANANIKADFPIVFIGFMGGLVIESWGTQTHLWNYFTFERPPLWIIPAWPIASLSIDRLFRLINLLVKKIPENRFVWVYWTIFTAFYAYMLSFVWVTIDKSLTVMSLVLCAFLILTPTNYRATVITFLAGSGLGYFLELWGTTRLCWTYYTFQQPPFFAVLAHGMAAVSFLRVYWLFHTFKPHLASFLLRKRDFTSS